ncbi:MAG: AAA family ATPase [Lachnospiraceae bacterium]
MIHRLELHNFKCFENAEIECSPLTMLCGVNSCGKSSVIQAVLLLEETRCSTGMIDLMNMQHGTVLYSFDEILYDDAEDDKIRIGITMMGKSVNLILSSDENDNNVRCKIPTEELSNLQKLGTIWYLGSDRMISQYQKRGNTAKFELGKKNEYLGFILEKGRSGKIAVDKRRNLRDAENTLFTIQLNEWLDYILPGNKVIAEDLGSDNLISLRFGKEQKLHKTNVGYGVSFVLPILVSGLLAKEGDVVIVENPELHLHPKAQSDLMFFLAQLAAIGVQIIIETHSDHIVNGLRKAVVNDACALQAPQAVIYFFDENFQMHEITIKDDAELSDWPKDFMEQEEIDLYYIRKMRMAHENKHADEHTDTM